MGTIIFFITGCENAGAVTVNVTKGSAVLIRFTDYWSGRGLNREEIVMVPHWYEVRFAWNPARREILFAAMSDNGYWGEIYSERTGEKPAEDWYSSNFFAVIFGDKPQVRPATKGEWNSAVNATGRSKKLFPLTQEDLKSKSFQYKGRAYAKTSDNWGEVLLSPNGKWLAIFSYSGRKTQGDLFTSGEPPNGDVFWEVYNTKTGEKALSWNAKFADDPAMGSGGAVWIGEEYFATPLDMSRQACVIGALPKE